MAKRKILHAREKALRDINGLKESIAFAFRNLATLELTNEDRIAICRRIDDLTACLAAGFKKLERGG